MAFRFAAEGSRTLSTEEDAKRLLLTLAGQTEVNAFHQQMLDTKIDNLDFFIPEPYQNVRTTKPIGPIFMAAYQGSPATLAYIHFKLWQLGMDNFDHADYYGVPPLMWAVLGTDTPLAINTRLLTLLALGHDIMGVKSTYPSNFPQIANANGYALLEACAAFNNCRERIAKAASTGNRLQPFDSEIIQSAQTWEEISRKGYITDDDIAKLPIERLCIASTSEVVDKPLRAFIQIFLTAIYIAATVPQSARPPLQATNKQFALLVKYGYHKEEAAQHVVEAISKAQIALNSSVGLKRSFTAAV